MFAAAVLVHVVLGDALAMPRVDLDVYRAGGDAILHAEPLYELRSPATGMPFTYPVFAALLFVPFAMLPGGAAHATLIVISLAALVAICVSSLGMAGLRWRDQAIPAGLALAGLAVFSNPVTRNLALGQINVVLTALVLLDVAFLRRTRWHGLLIGLAAAVKLVPFLFVVYLVLVGRRRAALTASATFGGAALLGLLLEPGQSWLFWTRHMFDPTRVGSAPHVANQSLRGVVARLLHDDLPPASVTLALGAAVVGAALWAARRYEARGEELLGVSIIGLAGLLASPIAWTHHWVWTVPALVALVAAVLRDRLHTDPLRIGLAVLGTVCFVDVYRVGVAMPRPLHPDWPAVFTASWQQMCGASYVIVGLGYLTWAVVRAHRQGVRAEREAVESPPWPLVPDQRDERQP